MIRENEPCSQLYHFLYRLLLSSSSSFFIVFTLVQRHCPTPRLINQHVHFHVHSGSN